MCRAAPRATGRNHRGSVRASRTGRGRAQARPSGRRGSAAEVCRGRTRDSAPLPFVAYHELKRFRRVLDVAAIHTFDFGSEADGEHAVEMLVEEPLAVGDRADDPSRAVSLVPVRAAQTPSGARTGTCASRSCPRARGIALGVSAPCTNEIRRACLRRAPRPLARLARPASSSMSAPLPRLWCRRQRTRAERPQTSIFGWIGRPGDIERGDGREEAIPRGAWIASPATSGLAPNSELESLPATSSAPAPHRRARRSPRTSGCRRP